jgi:hypothetical protein
MRNVKILSIGVSKSSGKRWAKGVSPASAEEQLEAMKLGVDPKGSLFGFIRGIPDEAVSKLSPGDMLAGEFETKISPTTYEKDGEIKAALDVTFFASGAISRTQHVTTDW